MNAKVRAVYGKEMRDMVRDRRTIFAAVVIPVLVYPILTLGTAEVALMAKARLAREEYSVSVPPRTQPLIEAILKVAREAPEPERGIRAHDKKKSGDTEDPAKDDAPKDELKPEDSLKTAHFTFREMTVGDARAELASGKLRAIVTLPADFEERLAQARDPEVTIEYDRAERISLSTATRLREMFERYQSVIIEKRLKEHALPEAILHPFTLDSKDMSPPEKLSGSIFGMILPLVFIMMLMTGALHPAIDMTAGEKERSTLETLIGAPVRPIEIVTGKFLAVGTLSLANAALNVASCTLSLKGLPLPSNVFQVPWTALPLTLLLLLPLACFFSALLLMLCSFAANTKEAQVFCLPVFLVPMVVLGITMTPGVELEGPLLILPIVNVALLIKELFVQHATLQQILFVFLSTSLYAAGMVALAARVFAREEVLFSTQGSLRMFLSRRFFKPAPTPRTGDALLVAALLFPLYFYMSLYLQKFLASSPGKVDWVTVSLLVLIPQYGLFLALPILIAKYLKVDLKTTFLWHRPSPLSLLGAAMMGATSWILAIQLASWQSYLWEYNGDKSMEEAFKQFNETGLRQALLLFLISLTPAICEEHFFRGFLQQGLGRKNRWGVLLAVAGIFAFYHFPVFRQPIVGTFGLALGYVAWKTRSIFPGILLHCLHNGLSLVGPSLLHLPAPEPVPGMPLPGLPAAYVAPAAVIFALGAVLIRWDAREKEDDLLPLAVAE